MAVGVSLEVMSAPRRMRGGLSSVIAPRLDEGGFYSGDQNRLSAAADSDPGQHRLIREQPSLGDDWAREVGDVDVSRSPP
jgi:hypothetical protein